MLVGKRRRLLDYLMRKDINRYRAIIAHRKSWVSASKRYSKTSLERYGRKILRFSLFLFASVYLFMKKGLICKK